MSSSSLSAGCKMASTSERYAKRKLNIQQTRQNILQQSILASQKFHESFDSTEENGAWAPPEEVRPLKQSQPGIDTFAGRILGLSPKAKSYDIYSPTRSVSDASISFVEKPYNRENDLSSTILTGNPGGISSMSVADLSNLSLMVEKDPEVCGSGVLFSSFKETLCLYPNAGQVFEMVAAYEKNCRDHIQNLLDFVNQVDPSRKKLQKTAKMISFLHQECYTWRLMSSLIKDRLMIETGEVKMEQDELAVTDEFSSQKEVVEKLFIREPSVRYGQMIIDWLEKNANDKINDLLINENIQFGSDSVSWEHTLHGLMQPSNSRSIRTVTEMDPDAPVRQKRHLADLDQLDESRLLQIVFSFIRAGRLEDAKNICIKHGQSWRAATLDGWQLWNDPNFETMSDNEELKHTEGNLLAKLWKHCCWKMCEDDNISQQEKPIYAALSGNLKQLLSVCESWEDCLWAYFRALVDSKVEKELNLIHNQEINNLQLQTLTENEELTASKIFEELEAHQDQSIKAEGKEVFHLVQKFLILDKPESLLKMIEDDIDGKDLVSAHMLRFLTHAVIFFQTIGLDIDDELYTKLIQRYIEVLIEKSQGDHVAVYTAKLSPDIQIEIYCKFLEQIDNLQERQHFLELARNANLNVQAITKAVVENICQNNPSGLPQENYENETDGDKKKIQAIDLLVFEPSQRIDAIIQANAIIIGFLALNKLDSANEVFEKLPEDSIEIIHSQWERDTGTSHLSPVLQNAIKEHLCIKAYLNAHDAFNSWFEHFKYKAPSKPPYQRILNFKDQIAHEELMNDYKARYEMWNGHLNNHVQNVSDKIYNVLLFPEGWMIDSHQIANKTRHNHQMELLRQIAIPRLCFMLHSVFHSSEEYKQCLQLADIVQSEQQKLYTIIKKEDLQKLLSLFKDSSLALLNQSKNFIGF